ncbi:multiple sugar transport system permease protein/putative aldouronate transport system permease protein [Bacillus niacini]|jgi:putative aldouronate transport system permease protein|uniref:Multiple sugar transport system permease protein/putative aldouronate transport system permease protein n=1 Tax=Neobacillus niacini TaxID=86668 RepID=A0A852T6H2_9BACI|nr:carbohydrate ABC transporter permease [Neobacillus niacini]NYE03475.1 multiple sugar transport system permease protein/putative aldouronate transport system permease protein [Neobacillus niacini]TDL64717.1 carbohydrate ABC transporter permease [Rhodococcus qingshengii]
MNTKIGESRGDRIFTVCNYIFLSLLVLSVLYPLIYVLSASLSSTNAVASGRVWLFPVEFSLLGYKTIFEYSKIWTGYGNSLFYMVVGTTVNVVLTILAAYPLSRRDFYGRGIFMFLFVFTMMFNGGLIPNYLLVQDLGLLNSRWALIIPNALSVFNVIITMSFFKSTIPNELLESAQLDGCNDFKFLFKVVLPLSAPIIAVISLFYAVGHWNSYFSALIYLRDASLFPLQLILRDILVQNSVDPSMMGDATQLANKIGLQQLLKYSLIVVSSLPVLIAYPFVQRFFVKGVMIGSLKG